jgi:hypothetical protein
MLVLWKLRPRWNFEERRYQLRVGFRQNDLLPHRRSRRGEQLLDGDVRFLLRVGL